jgi:ribosomal protein S18 acetylase RimI-like enzyme
MKNVNIRPADPGDADAVVEVVRESFRPGDLELTIYGCPGIAAYLRRQFEAARFSSLPPLVAEVERSVIGFAELRRTRSSLTLNYIAVRGSWQGHGIAATLLSRALEQAGYAAGEPLSLEVFEHNTAARDWYARMGFETRLGMNFLRAHMPLDGGRRGAIVESMPQAEVCHEQFGFSTFTVGLGSKSFSVGRLGSRWFKITDPALLTSPGVLDLLARIDAERELLAVIPDTAPHYGGRLEFKPIIRALKMRCCLPLPPRSPGG